MRGLKCVIFKQIFGDKMDVMKLEIHNFEMGSFHFEEAAYSHHYSKIETADEIRTCENYQNIILSNLLLQFYVQN